MRQQLKKLLSICITAVMVFTAIGVIPPGAKVYAEMNTGTCESLNGENVNDQDYAVTASPVYSYLVKHGTGYMRVQADIDDSGDYGIEYYDQQFNRTGYRTIDAELPLFGAFYESSDYYYIVSGQSNHEQSDTVETIRLTKYDKDWNRLSAVGAYATNTYCPFTAASCRIDTSGDYMVIRTAHEMYAAREGGLNHQATLTLLINTNTMEVVDTDYGAANIYEGRASHSLNQFVKIENNKMVAVDHGDCYPRSIVLTQNPLDITQGDIAPSVNIEAPEEYPNKVIPTTVLHLVGLDGENDTGASVGGLEIMGSSYLIAGSSIVQDDKHYGDTTRNAFIASVDKSTNEVTFNWLTNYEDCDDSLTRTTTTPHLVKLSDDKCLIMWSREAEDKIYYATVDESGALTSEIYSQTGHLSDCVPLLDDGKLIWYVWRETSTDFYTLSLSDMSLNITNQTFYHTREPIALDGTTSTMKCTKCGDEKTGPVQTDYEVWWKNASIGDYPYHGSITQMEQDEQLIIRFSGFPDDLESVFRTMVVELADPTMGSVSMPYYDGEATITWAKEGKAVIYIYPLSVKGLEGAEKFKRTYEITIGGTDLTEIQDKAYLRNPNESIVYTGQPHEPEAGISGLTEGVDYEMSYKNNVDAGTGTIVFTGKGKYYGTIELEFTIKPKSITSKDLTIEWVVSHAYTGKEVEPDVNIEGLTRDKDFELSYSNNIDVGTGKITIKGICNYKGTVTKQFLINRKSIKNAAPTLEKYSFVYTGANIRPAGTIEGLTLDKDYQISYRNNVNVGTATAVFTGIGNCQGQTTCNFEITPASITDKSMSLQKNQYTYNGTALKPVVSIKDLVSKTDFTVNYLNNIDAGKATAVVTGIGNYRGTAELEFNIDRASIKNKSVTAPKGPFMYTGSAVEPEYKINGLVKDKDYQVTYENNVKVGTATATITGIGNYKDFIENQFTVDKVDISKMKATLSTTVYTYNGYKKSPKVTIKGLKNNSDFKVTYTNNRSVGKATVTITGIGNCKGKITKTFKINPKGTYISKLSKSKKAFTVKWKKQSAKMASSRITGYQVRYSTSSKMTSAKTKTIAGYSKTGMKVSKLKAKRTYYVQVRTYKTVSGIKYYSTWSKIKRVKTK